MLRSAPDGVFYLVSRFVNFSKLCGTLFLIPKLLPVPNYQNKKRKEKRAESVEQAGTTMKQSPTTQCILLAGTVRGELGAGEMEELRHTVVGSREDTDRDRKMSWEFLKPWRKCQRYFDDTHPCLLVWVLGGFILTQKNTEKICSTLSE